MLAMIKLSIVTVCWNAEKEIVETLRSVFSQNYTNYEYVVVDGGSTDNTVNTILSIAKECGKEDCLVLTSEKDNGIYDAMNKGIIKSTGNWVVFMNAGDTFYDNNVLCNVATILDKSSADIVYGNNCYTENNTQYIYNAKDIHFITKGMPFCHQSVFNRRDSIIKYMYNTDFKICADYELYFRMYHNGAVFEKIDTIICNYMIGGFSFQSPQVLVRESLAIRHIYSNLHCISLRYYLTMITVYINRFLKTILPQAIVKWIKENA